MPAAPSFQVCEVLALVQSIHKVDVNAMKVEICSCSALQLSRILLVLPVSILLLLVVWTASNKPVTYITLRQDIGTPKIFTANSKYSDISFSYK